MVQINNFIYTNNSVSYMLLILSLRNNKNISYTLFTAGVWICCFISCVSQLSSVPWGHWVSQHILVSLHHCKNCSWPPQVL